MKLSNLEPKPVWRYFNEIRRIPRCSGNEEQIGKYLLSVARKNNLKAKKDEVGNVVIHKPAKREKRELPPLIFQCHLDMVCEKNADVDHNFSEDPIPIKREGDWLTAKGTTLGADNGIGVAIALALATEKVINSRPLALLFTVDEERGLTGASHLEKDFVDGNALINLDSEEMGTIIIGCAGGGVSKLNISLATERIQKGTPKTISVSNLQGGHSGLDIDKGRGNAIKLLMRVLEKIHQKEELRISQIEGGDKHNAIPREASAMVVIQEPRVLRNVIKKQKASFREEFEVEKELEIESHKPPRKLEKAFTKGATEKIINLLLELPHGVIAWSEEMEDLVETSTNLAKVSVEECDLNIVMSSRSSIESSLQSIRDKIWDIGERYGAKVTEEEPYPPWKPNPRSHLLQVAKEEYQRVFGNSPEVEAIHAGLETAIIGKKFEGLEMISIGPTLEHPHSPKERVKISSVAQFWKYILSLIETLSKKG